MFSGRARLDREIHGGAPARTRTSQRPLERTSELVARNGARHVGGQLFATKAPWFFEERLHERGLHDVERLGARATFDFGVVGAFWAWGFAADSQHVVKFRHRHGHDDDRGIESERLSVEPFDAPLEARVFQGEHEVFDLLLVGGKLAVSILE